MTTQINKNTKQINIILRNRLIASVIVMALAIAVTIVSLAALHSQTGEECWQNLRVAARTADDQLGVLVSNTFANLNNIGNLLTDFGAIDGEDVAREVGGSRIGSMQMEMRLYLPDGRTFTADGILDDVSDRINYSEIVDSLDAEGRYISCAKKDFLNPEMIVMEYFVPIKKDGKIVALLSSVMDTSKLQNRITSNAYDATTRVYCFDTRDGMVFLDNDHKQVYSITSMYDRIDKNGKSIQPYLDDVMNRRESSTTVVSDRYGVPALMFCIPSETNENWVIQIVVRESIAFAAESNVRKAIFIIAATEIGLFVIFLIWLLLSVRREKAKIIKEGEEKRKALADNLEESLTFTNFFLSTYIAAYYVNLDDCGCQIYKRPKSIETNYPVIDNYYESLNQYSNNVVHPDDRKELMGILSPDSLRKILKKAPDYTYFYRDISGGVEKTIRLQVIRGADENHAAFGFADVTNEFEEQQKRLLGAVPISPDILSKEQIGMWAFELDEGKLPRMYGDEAMIKLVGLDHQVPPEEMYHAWYDHIDEESYKLVNDAVEKMMAGEHAEVQYPWHHPDGHTMIVRCGGVRNPEYTKGIRVEGTHQNVTEVLHFDDEERKALAENNARMLALEDNIVSLYDLDLETGEYEMYVKKDANNHGIISKVIKGNNFFEDTVKNGQTVIYPEDMDSMIKVLNADYIRLALEKDNHFDYYYRLLDGDTPVWAKIRIVYKDAEKRRVIIGAFNAEEEMAIILKDEEYLKAKELELKHMEFRASALDYLVANEEDIASYLNYFAGRLRELIDCDQVIYRDANGTMLINNAPKLGDEFRIPIEVCQNCNHYDIFDPVYRNGISEMSDTRLGADGVPVNSNCPVKSSLTCIVTLNGKANGYLSIHYLLKHHEFSDYERQTLKEFTRLLSILLSRYVAKTENQQLTKELELKKQIEEQNEKLNNNMQLIGGLASGYNALYCINIDEKTMHIYALDETKYPGSRIIFEKNEGDIYDNIRFYGLSEQVHPEDRHLFERFGPKWIREKLTNRKKFAMRFRVVTDGGYRWDEMELTKYEEIEEIANAVAVGFTDRDADIRRELEYQQQLEEARNEAETANQSKTNFLFNMSHDIRTPMNAITGFTNMAKKHISDREKVADSLNKIDSSGKQLLALINQVLEMARIESGKIELELKPINVSREFNSAVTVLAEQAKNKGLEFVYYARDIKHNDVLADMSRVSSISLNITGNAMKYTPRGGRIEYALREIAPRKNGYATFVFSVEDTGIGMSEDYLKVLFDPFTREKNSTVSKIQGTGLGMSIVKDLVDLMGGDIDVRSKPGKGTRFEITIDFEIVDKVDFENIVDTRDFNASFVGKRLLLVEDNELNREIAIDILVEEGFDIEEAEDGTVAVELLKEKGPDYYDFILMDIQMPVMNGYEATRAIRDMYPSAKLPIIALSANAFSEDKEKSLEAGMDEHVAKPIEINELFAALVKCI